MMELISREAAIDAAEVYPEDELIGSERHWFVMGALAARDAIRALTAQAPEVKVRALKWSRVSGVWSGNSKVGATYLVDKNPYSGVWGWAFGDDADEADWNDGFRTVGEAKAAAQADYEARILAALDLS